MKVIYHGYFRLEPRKLRALELVVATKSTEHFVLNKETILGAQKVLSILSLMDKLFLSILYLGCTRKTRILDVVYNATNNELVRTKTLVKGAIVQIDATPFRQWYEAHYATPLGRKRMPKVCTQFF